MKNSSSSRFCSRCRKDLTDAASMEAGVGPICRKMDNHLLARTIPHDMAMARHCWANVDMDAVPEECVPVLRTINGVLESTDDAAMGLDWRETVKRVEWVASHALPDATRAALFSFVQALGYVGLVSMWLGEAASGKATVWFADGRLFLKGPRNRAGNQALKAISGRVFHATTSTWSVPAARYQVFAMAVMKHWPNDEGLEGSLLQVSAWLEKGALVEESAPTSPPPPLVEVKENGDILTVRTPYNQGFVSDLKKVNWSHRLWDKTQGVWLVNHAHKPLVTQLIQQYFGVAI